MSITEPTINEPFLLANYGHSQRLAARRTDQPNIYATHTPKAGSRADGYVTVTTQGDGVHVLDVGTLRPVISYTLGPSTTFSCPTLTTHTVIPSTNGEKDKIFTTYAVMQSSPSSGLEEGGDAESHTPGRTIWVWKENLSQNLVDRAAGTSAVKKKTEIQAPYTIASLSTSPELPDRVIGLSPSGQIALWDTDLQLKQAYSNPHRSGQAEGESDVWKSFVFARHGCTFVSSRMENVPVRGAIVVFARVGKGKEQTEVELQVLAIDEQDIVSLVGTCKVELKNKDLVDIICSNSGDITILALDGTWYAYRVEPSSDYTTIEISPSTDPIQLTGMSFISSTNSVPSTKPSKKSKAKSENATSSTPSAKTPNTISLLPLHSSLVLLASISNTSENQEIILLVWDSQFSIVLASYSLPIPSALTQSKEMGIEIRLAPTTNPASRRDSAGDDKGRVKEKESVGGLQSSQALLLLSTVPLSTSSSPSAGNLRSSVLVVPFVVPVVSTIAAALGRASATAKWIKSPEPDVTGGSIYASPSPGYDEGRKKVLQSMRSAMEKNRPQAANSAFLEWEEKERKKLAKEKQDSKETVDKNAGELSLESSEPQLDYSFVKDVLHTVLQPHKPANAPYSSELVRSLIRRRKVSSSMFDGGLLSVLRYKDDWSSIELALQYVDDLSELEIIESLKIVILNHLQLHQQEQQNAMQVDQPVATAISSLASFLALCISYPPPNTPSSNTLSASLPSSLSPSTKAQVTSYLSSSSSLLPASSSSPFSISSTKATQPLRQAIQHHIQNPDEIVVLLKVLEGWLERWRDVPEKLVPAGKEVALNGELGVWVVDRRQGSLQKRQDKEGEDEGEEKDEEPLPSLEKVVGFIQTILDSSFLILIQHKPSHGLLKRLSTLIQPEIKYSEQVEVLRGPLRPFVVKQERVVKEAVEGKWSKESDGKGVDGVVSAGTGATGAGKEKDWKQRRKQMHEQQSMGVGLYRLEELVL
ncbi:hypothetical protein AX16_007782 [Volvariella volvacea WC 439]|nr:hypothetical protein AX16_007782 [Volvariella volvacea WC 439]